MRWTMIIFATVLTIAAIWGTTVNGGRSPHKADGLASPALDVMGMMKKAKNLPEERFDAH
jgi:hypothetical protein